jgi:shikimate kinase
MITKIILVGMMGVGKTTIAKSLSKRLEYEFIDLDKQIEHQTGVKISTIFEFEGEKGFRERENAVLQESLECQKVVISTGGGIVVKKSNRNLLKKHEAAIFYLKADISILSNRLRNDKSRPMLNNSNKENVLKKLMVEREKFYTDVSDYILDTSYMKTDKVVEEILQKLETL